jgi:outer membrane protein assembly factor BamE (lipoprotein component of BamABCDE complex)
MTKATATLFFALSIIEAACGGGDSINQTGTCLTDVQVCSLALGATTQDDVLKRFGTPSQTILETNGAPDVSYVCLRFNNGALVYSEDVDLQFDANNLLTDVVMTRGGADSTPVPACVANLKN